MISITINSSGKPTNFSTSSSRKPWTLFRKRCKNKRRESHWARATFFFFLDRCPSILMIIKLRSDQEFNWLVYFRVSRGSFRLHKNVIILSVPLPLFFKWKSQSEKANFLKCQHTHSFRLCVVSLLYIIVRRCIYFSKKEEGSSVTGGLYKPASTCASAGVSKSTNRKSASWTVFLIFPSAFREPRRRRRRALPPACSLCDGCGYSLSLFFFTTSARSWSIYKPIRRDTRTKKNVTCPSLEPNPAE